MLCLRNRLVHLSGVFRGVFASISSPIRRPATHKSNDSAFQNLSYGFVAKS
jgi:hypothetical protein